MNTVVIVQARLTSTRLPGKVLKPIGERPALYHTLFRASVPNFPLILAVPDNQLAAFREATAEHDLDWNCGTIIGGSENDVLGRFAKAIWDDPLNETPDVVVRLTGDCPFVDPRMVWACAYYAAQKNCYVSNCWPERSEPKGLDVEAFPIWALVDADLYATEDYDREHVTPWIQRHVHVERLQPVTNRPDLRWVLDTQEDYDWFCKLATMIDCTPPHPTTRELLAFLKDHPEMERTDGSASAADPAAISG